MSKIVTQIMKGYFCNELPFFLRSFAFQVHPEMLIPIPFLCDRIKENTRKHMWKGMNIIHGTSNHTSGLPSVSGGGQRTHENREACMGAPTLVDYLPCAGFAAQSRGDCLAYR